MAEPECVETFETERQARERGLVPTKEAAKIAGFKHAAFANRLRRRGVRYYLVGKRAKWYDPADLEEAGFPTSAPEVPAAAVEVVPTPSPRREPDPEGETAEHLAGIYNVSTTTMRERLDAAGVGYVIGKGRGRPRLYDRAQVRAMLGAVEAPYLSEITALTPAPFPECCEGFLHYFDSFAFEVAKLQYLRHWDGYPEGWACSLRQVEPCDECGATIAADTTFELQRSGGGVGPTSIVSSTRVHRTEPKGEA